jgi:HEXXH motif-containing protein
MNDIARALIEQDCTGVLFGSGPGTTCDTLRALSALTLGKALVARCAEAAQQLPEPKRSLATVAHRALSALDPATLAEVVAHPLASSSLERQPLDALECAKLARWLPGAPGVYDCSMVFPADFVDGAGLYLPHLHLTVRGLGGPVATHVEQDRTMLVWSDGTGAEVPHGFCERVILGDARRLVAHPIVLGVPVLNFVEEHVPGVLDLGAASLGEVQVSRTDVEAASALLKEIWPEAADDVANQLGALVLLARRSFSRSHSPAEAPGLVALTSDGPEKVADMLCHECAHVRLSTFLAHDALLRNSDKGGYESPWRPDRRPLLGLLLGVHAFIAVCGYYRRLQRSDRQAEVWSEVLKRQQSNVAVAWSTLVKEADTTPLGEVVLSEMKRAVEEVLADD